MCAFVLAGRVLLASAGSDGTVRLWNPITGTLERALEGHTDWVTSVCTFECDGRTLLASGSADGTLRLWDPATGALEQVMSRHTGHVYAVCPFPSGGRTLLASGGADGTVPIWDPDVREYESTLRGHFGRVHSVCSFISAERTVLSSGDAFGMLRVRDPETGRQIHSRQIHNGESSPSASTTCAPSPRRDERFSPSAAIGRYGYGIPPPGPRAGRGRATKAECSRCAPSSPRTEPFSPPRAMTEPSRSGDATTGDPERTLDDRTEGIRSACACAFDIAGQPFLAVCADRTVRISSISGAGAVQSIPVHHAAHTIQRIGDLLVVALSAGLLAFEVHLP